MKVDLRSNHLFVAGHSGGTACVYAGDTGRHLLRGSTLYVVQLFLNRIAVTEFAPDLRSGVITGYLVSPALDGPTTAAFFGRSLYAVNSRIDTPREADTEYHVVKVPLN